MPSHDELVSALKDALAADPSTTPLLIRRIPFICTEIEKTRTVLENIDKRLDKHDTDMDWIKMLGYGILGGIGLLALKSLGI